jgi:hypothetical protein
VVIYEWKCEEVDGSGVRADSAWYLGSPYGREIANCSGPSRHIGLVHNGTEAARDPQLTGVRE